MSRIVRLKSDSCRASRRSTFFWSTFSSIVSSMTTIRRSGGNILISAFRSVVFPEPVPPATSTLPPWASVAPSRSSTSCGSEPSLTSSAPVITTFAKRRIVTAGACDAGGRHIATRLPSASRASPSGVTSGSTDNGRPIE